MDIVKATKEYSKTIETGEDPGDFEDITAKQTEMSKNSHDWKNEGCGICKYPRTEHQRYVIKHRLCKFLFDTAFILGGTTRITQLAFYL